MVGSSLKTPSIKSDLKFIREEYYIKKNLKRYIEYFIKVDGEFDIRTIVTMVNAQADKTPYVDVEEADTSKGHLMLCNRYNYLTEDYINPNLINVSKDDSYIKTILIDKFVYEQYLLMKKEAVEQGNAMWFNGDNAYRGYKKQEDAFNYYVKAYDYQTSLSYAAKPGYSEHQKGYGVDLMFNFVNNGKNSYKDFDWLIENCWDYGFILRYPEGMEMITNNYEPWHYRYVGTNVSLYLKEHKITFDEYYNYFLVDNYISTEEFVKMFE